MSSSPRVTHRQSQGSRSSRGSINKRACENCRRLKIRCDGNADRGIDCSNCDAGTCVFDKSPRKNRQVEKLSNQVSNLERNLENIKNDLNQQIAKSDHIIEVLKLEKEIQSLLYNCQSYFRDCEENQEVFEQLNQVIAKSQCWSILLYPMRELLFRLSQSTADSVSIISTLKMIAENTLRFCQPGSSLNSTINPPPELTQFISPSTTPTIADPYNGNASSEFVSTPIYSVSTPIYSVPTNDPSPTMMITLQPQVGDGSDISESQQQVGCMLTPFSNMGISDFDFYLNEMNDGSPLS